MRKALKGAEKAGNRLCSVPALTRVYMAKKKNIRTYIDTLDTADRACYVDIIYEGTEQELAKEISENGDKMIRFIYEDTEDDIASVYVRADSITSFNIYDPAYGLPEAHVVRINTDGTVADDPHEGEREASSSNQEKNSYHGGTLVFSKDKNGKVISEEIDPPRSLDEDDIENPPEILKNMNQEDVKTIELSLMSFMDNNIINIGTLIGTLLKKIFERRQVNLPLEEIINTLFSVITSLIMTKVISDKVPADSEDLDSTIEFDAMISIGIVIDLLNYLYYAVDDVNKIEEILSMDTENLVAWTINHINEI